ncbi:hypothetical protein EFY87_17695 [Flexivirga caeni]|uniref:Uncharacterized protein n=1 Tax=Flexivirga caeni TaxID=2294115 RepID=A0A3M9LYL2_9MICO|nr:hypothetical protein EFY87_17695 [Flexivirga caeni]
MHGTLYHRPATAVRGPNLLPLNVIRTRHPDLYERHVQKYAHDPSVLSAHIPPLGCTWGDVVFLSPVHPAPLFEALRRVGKWSPRLEPWSLPAAHLDPARTTIRLMRAGSGGHHCDPADADDYLPFTTAGLRAVSRVTVAAIERLERLQPGDPWLPWVDVPHVLYRGEIPVSWFRQPSADGRSAH